MSRSAGIANDDRMFGAVQAWQGKRALRLLLAGGWVMLVLGLAWATFFAWDGEWLLAGIELILALLGGTAILAMYQHRMGIAKWLVFVGTYTFVCMFVLWLDVRTGAVPSNTHLFLLVLAACAHYVLSDEAAWLRRGAIALFLATFVVFAVMPHGNPADFAVSDRMRSIGAWVNALNVASVAVCLMLVLRLQDSDRRADHALHRALRDALVARRFELFYQPQMDAAGRIVGAEALLRWRDPKRGLVLPGEFVRAAGETGFILPLGHWVLATACEQLHAWQQHPQLGRLRLSVNVCALQLQQPEFVAQVLGLLQRHGLAGEQLTLELTETVLLQDTEGVVDKMQALREAGVRLSLDDFGTGYSSLAYLRKFPLSELKIDRVFVAGIHRDQQVDSIIRSLLQLGKDLGIDVIAEGIEQPEQHAFLREQGCPLFQGYLFGKPMERAAFERLVTESGETGSGSLPTRAQAVH